jgi:hypothetical protein
MFKKSFVIAAFVIAGQARNDRRLNFLDSLRTK